MSSVEVTDWGVALDCVVSDCMWDGSEAVLRRLLDSLDECRRSFLKNMVDGRWSLTTEYGWNGDLII